LALVTGGTRGIGLAISRKLHQEGANVIAVSNAPDQVEAFGREFQGDTRAAAELADVRDRAALERLRDQIGPVDIVVPNAGVVVRAPFLELDDAAVREMIDTNLYGCVLTCQVFGEQLVARGGGRVIVTSSVVAVLGFKLRAVYTSTKAAVSGLVRSLAVEWGPSGVTVNAVGPGVIRTPLTDRYIADYPERAEETIRNTPLRRLGTPEEIADVVAFLASNASRFITGQTILVDGGLSAGTDWW
jgi:NAD(P)-dependent dehydrogenase (short-subunit alcohol dehydrogenase family)